jgi:hypothetical protein
MEQFCIASASQVKLERRRTAALQLPFAVVAATVNNAPAPPRAVACRSAAALLRADALSLRVPRARAEFVRAHSSLRHTLLRLADG